MTTTILDLRLGPLLAQSLAWATTYYGNAFEESVLTQVCRHPVFTTSGGYCK
jgi:hypothetical protein